MATPPVKATGPRGAKEAVNISEEDFRAKAATGRLTVREALSYTARNIRGDSKSINDNRNRTFNLMSNLIDEGIDIDQPYLEIYDKEDFNKALDPIESASGTNRWQPWNWAENRIISNIKRAKPNDANNIPRKLAGKGGIAQEDFNLVGVQSRNTDPMRGTIFSEDLDKLYDEALSGSTYEVYNETTEKMEIKAIDPEARDYLIYEKYTGQRVATNIGKDGLKIGEITFGQRDGVFIAEVAGVQKANKVRPEVTYTGEFAEFLYAKVQQAKARVAAEFPGDNPAEKNIFKTTDSAVKSLWDARIKPALEENFRNQLPEKAGGNHKVIRKILARQMLREFRFPRDAVKAWMGHAGVGVDNAGDILEQNYTGAVPDERIGVMSNALIQQDAKNGGHQTVNQLFVSRNLDVPRMADSSVVFAVPERVTNLTTIGEASNVTTEASEAQRKLIDETAKKQAVIVSGEREVLERQQEEARIARANKPLPKVDETIVRANARRNQEVRDIQADERRIMALEKAEADNPLPKAELSPSLQAKMVELGLMDEPPKPKKRRRRKAAKKAAIAAGTTAATVAAKGAKAAGMLIPGPDPLELVAGVIDEQVSEPGKSAADIAVEKGQGFMGDIMGVEPRRAESMGELLTPENVAYNVGSAGGVLADALTLGTVSGTGPFSGERTGNISGRNRARNARARQYSGPKITNVDELDGDSFLNMQP
tara:strand:- start:1461 stop:3590 length:2130 start_codon:yes stop_codon:yes gene_type:complete